MLGVGSRSTTTLDELQLAVRCHHDSACCGDVRRALDAMGAEAAGVWAKSAAADTSAQLLGARFGTAQLQQTDEVWRAEHGGWKQITISDESEEGESWQDMVWLPAAASGTIVGMLFALTVELQRCIGVSHASGSSADTVHLSQLLRQESWSAICSSYGRVIETESCTEAVVLQILFDLSFVQMVIGSAEGRVATVVASLFEDAEGKLDPVDWELYAPLLNVCVEKQFNTCSLLLSAAPPQRMTAKHATGKFLAGQRLDACQSALPISDSHGNCTFMFDTRSRTAAAHGAVSDDADVVPLAATVGRFALLPAPKRRAHGAEDSRRASQSSTGKAASGKAFYEAGKSALSGALGSVWGALS